MKNMTIEEIKALHRKNVDKARWDKMKKLEIYKICKKDRQNLWAITLLHKIKKVETRT